MLYIFPFCFSNFYHVLCIFQIGISLHVDLAYVVCKSDAIYVQI